ncbi:MAG: CPBP family intramembrane metalloprotease [Clostridiales bacterium]|nr:CPBP family intramembrane metalloprotease [Clostridiales bacterium]
MKIKTTFTAPILVMAVLLLLAASHFLDLSMLAYQENICLAVIVLQLLILVVPTGFYAKLRGGGFMKRMRIAPFGIEQLLVTLLAALTLVLGDALLKLGLYNLGLVDGDYSVYYYYISGEEPNFLYAMLTFCIIPAIAEELLFRSVICAEYESSGTLTAVIASAALYAMYGINFGYFPIYFLAGMIFALVMYLTRSVLASMICHIIYNAAMLTLSETVWNIIAKPQSTVFLVFVLAGLFLVCLVTLFGECERIYYGYSLTNKRSDYIKDADFSLRAFLEALLAPPFLMDAVVFIVASLQLS